MNLRFNLDALPDKLCNVDQNGQKCELRKMLQERTSSIDKDNENIKPQRIISFSLD